MLSLFDLGHFECMFLKNGVSQDLWCHLFSKVRNSDGRGDVNMERRTDLKLKPSSARMLASLL